MHLLWQRYARSGGAPPWLYWLIGAGFAVLAGFAITRGSWLVATLALVMIGVTAAGATMLRHANMTPLEAPGASAQAQEDEDEQ